MKQLFPLLVGLFFASSAAFAQGGAPVYPTVDPGAALIARAVFSTSVGYEIEAKRKGDNIANEIMFWRTGSNAVAAEIVSPSIVPETATTIDVIPTAEIYRQLAYNAVLKAIDRGYLTAGQSQVVGVWYESNVERTGVGMATRFAACTIYSAASRTFEVTWSAGVPTIVERAAAQTPAPCGTQAGTMQ